MSALPSPVRPADGTSTARVYRPRHVESVFPQVPLRQRAVTFPRRLRYFLHRDLALPGRVRRCVLRAIESGLRRRCPDAPSSPTSANP